MDRQHGITIGTPEDLALEGHLSGFFARKGIVFDMETGLFRVENQYSSQVRLVGHGQKYAMVRKALQRNGILANRNVESSVWVETGDLTTSGFRICREGENVIEVGTIEELLEQLKIENEKDYPLWLPLAQGEKRTQESASMFQCSMSSPCARGS